MFSAKIWYFGETLFLHAITQNSHGTTTPPTKFIPWLATQMGKVFFLQKKFKQLFEYELSTQLLCRKMRRFVNNVARNIENLSELWKIISGWTYGPILNIGHFLWPSGSGRLFGVFKNVNPCDQDMNEWMNECLLSSLVHVLLLMRTNG